jgi:hypothetical protein
MSIADSLQFIRAEYLEIPGLQLTPLQVQRFWSLDPLTCDAVLAALVDAGFLKRTRHDRYMRGDGGA